MGCRVIMFKEYPEYDAIGLVELIRQKQVTSHEVLEAAIAECEAKNPSVNAVTHRMYDLAQQSLATLNREAPFYGVPFLLKDLSLNYAGVPTTQGSRFFQEYTPQYDSELVTRYKKAGLVIMGKTNTPEFGTNWVTESHLLGSCRNPYDVTKTSGGSSGGSAAAVAARITPFAHASDGGGSIRVPASCCGLIGLKPTRARVPVGPDRGESCSGLSVHHAVTRSVRDCALLLDVTQGAELGDPYAAPVAPRSYLHAMQQPLPSLTIGLVTQAPGGYPVHIDCLAAATAAATWCEQSGHHVESITLPVDHEVMARATNTIWAAHLAHNLDQYAQVIKRAYTQQDVEPANWVLAKMGGRLPAKEYAWALNTMHHIGRQLAQLFLRYDVVLTPTLAMPPVNVGYLSYDESQGSVNDFYKDRAFGFAPFTSVFNVTGQPAISLPMYRTMAGLPIGVQFASRFGDELTLLQLAYQWESEITES